VNISLRYKSLLQNLQEINGDTVTADTAESSNEMRNCPALNDVSNVCIGLRKGTGISLKVNFLERSLAVIQSYI
jgi:hypothetical protein